MAFWLGEVWEQPDVLHGNADDDDEEYISEDTSGSIICESICKLFTYQ